MISLKKLIFKDFGLNLPISGGTGNSIEQPIIIDIDGRRDYTSIEYSVLNCIGIGRRIKWKILMQELIGHQGKMIDKIKIETTELTETEIITQIENYYFDITACFGSSN